MAKQTEIAGLQGLITPETAPWLSSAGLRAVFAAFNAAGLDIRAVGGAVRNQLLGLAIADVDLATSASPDAVLALAEGTGIRALPTGYAHGTVTLLANGQSFEVTTLRRDVETDGRHAVVAFGADWREDANRRDFTINALSCDADGAVYDYTGGLADIEARRVRFIGDAAHRIREDYLRILRFFRFTATYAQGAPDAEGLAAAAAEKAGLAQLSAERVRSELLKILTAPRAAGIVPVMDAIGILDIVAGGPADVPSLVRLCAIEQHLARTPDAILRLAVLTRTSAASADMPVRLRLSTDEAEQYHAAIANQNAFAAPGGEAARKALLFQMGAADYQRGVLAAWAVSGAPADDRAWRSDAQLPERWTPPPVPIRGADIVANGVPEGPAIGKILSEFTQWWIDSDFSAGTDAVKSRLDSLIQRHKTLKKAQK